MNQFRQWTRRRTWAGVAMVAFLHAMGDWGALAQPASDRPATETAATDRDEARASRRPVQSFVHVPSNLRRANNAELMRYDPEKRLSKEVREQLFTLPAIEWSHGRQVLFSIDRGRQDDSDLLPNLWWGSSGDDLCTSTAIGPRTLLTAAHCVADGQPVTLLHGVAGSNVAKCKRHPGYSTTSGAQACGFSAPAADALDVATCTLEPNAKFPKPRVGFETVSLAPPPSAVAASAPIGIDTLVGCGTDHDPQKLLAVQFTLEDWATAPAKATGRGLCKGDSGAPWTVAWKPGGMVLAVHVIWNAGGRSEAAKLSHECTANFLRGQATQAAPICGINAAPALCRQ